MTCPGVTFSQTQLWCDVTVCACAVPLFLYGIKVCTIHHFSHPLSRLLLAQSLWYLCLILHSSALSVLKILMFVLIAQLCWWTPSQGLPLLEGVCPSLPPLLFSREQLFGHLLPLDVSPFIFQFYFLFFTPLFVAISYSLIILLSLLLLLVLAFFRTKSLKW